MASAPPFHAIGILPSGSHTNPARRAAAYRSASSRGWSWSYSSRVPTAIVGAVIASSSESGPNGGLPITIGRASATARRLRCCLMRTPSTWRKVSKRSPQPGAGSRLSMKPAIPARRRLPRSVLANAGSRIMSSHCVGTP